MWGNSPKWGNGAQRQIRTADTTIFNRVLYQLSYPGTSALAHHDTSAGWKRRYGEARRAWQGEISPVCPNLRELIPLVRLGGPEQHSRH